MRCVVFKSCRHSWNISNRLHNKPTRMTVVASLWSVCVLFRLERYSMSSWTGQGQIRRETVPGKSGFTIYRNIFIRVLVQHSYHTAYGNAGLLSLTRNSQCDFKSVIHICNVYTLIFMLMTLFLCLY